MENLEKKWDSLPILDLSLWERGTSQQRERFQEDLREIAHELGFFYLIGHGIPSESIQVALNVSRKFFDLPDEEKLKIEMVHSPHFRGYNRVGAERTLGLPDFREQLDIGAERPSHSEKWNSEVWSRLQGPNQWPESFPEFRKIISSYQKSAADLAVRLIKAFVAALGQKEEVFDSILGESAHQLLKVIRYPGREKTESHQGVGAHKDGGFVTILLQDEREGLEVEHGGEWIRVPPIRDSFVVNIGELLELASDGYLRATVHRAIVPPEGTDRISIGYFYSARLDADIPLLELPENLRKGIRGLTQDPDNPLFYQVGKNLLKSRLRSHPDVAERHHPDLLHSKF
ncbi:isopenicillin N synthase family dioxygenase [Leptospira wolffii]|uniref:isopenicillin N synthase family dioxygenase n=1 Tax=Leptospira wolffii TaxID=409998 RepID=UPI00030B65D7|nr:2-oxoglutarate and iron-dependent oxygenase domain-containing protein [Leptospira wolffii]EPG67139.1 oxidoreductase, 2OG-Fe(II) oxygenase family protein [Leptospira wolffii serovar Khorat str. Khorat-H2]